MIRPEVLLDQPTSHIIGALAVAKAACKRLRDRGAVVLTVTVDAGRPLILIERPPHKLKATGEIIHILKDGDGRRVVREYHFDGCSVRWDD